MRDKQNILFIINPISGVGKKKIIPKFIDKYLDLTQFKFEIKYTQYRKHAHEIANQFKSQFDIIVAIGGDGTVNEIGSALVNSNCAMAIIPTGSGNGVARHLKIPLKIKKAIQKINESNQIEMDTGLINGVPFIGTCGFGFDAHIAKKFDDYHKRGFMSYAKLVKREFKRFQPLSYQVRTPGGIGKFTTFMFAVANTSEFGNGFVISPNSSVSDQIFELVKLDKFKSKDIIRLGKQIFSRQIHKSKFHQTLSVNGPFEVEIMGKTETLYHIDGEAMVGPNTFKIEIVPAGLKVIC